MAGFPVELRSQLEHLVLSHHGSREHGSPTEPKTLEAFILAAVDELDAKIHQVRRAMREDAGDGEFTAWHKRLGRVLYKGRTAERGSRNLHVRRGRRGGRGCRLAVAERRSVIGAVADDDGLSRYDCAPTWPLRARPCDSGAA